MTSPVSTGVELAPSYRLPLGLALLAVPLVWLNPWVWAVVSLFSFFLLVQAATLRLRFLADGLEITRSGQRIRWFPYQDWQAWRLFWPAVPVLLYFKEVKSIHFVPVLFDPVSLHACLSRYCGSGASQ